MDVKILGPTHCIAVEQENSVGIAVLLQTEVERMDAIEVRSGELQSDVCMQRDGERARERVSGRRKSSDAP